MALQRKQQAPIALQDRQTRAGYRMSQLIASWLAGFESASTREAYARDIRQWHEWCARRNFDPLEIRLPEVQVYAMELGMAPSPHNAKGYSKATIVRKLAAISSFYLYLVRNDVLDNNPARDAQRPKTHRRTSPTQSLNSEQAHAMMDYAKSYTTHKRLSQPAVALTIGCLLGWGVRVSELCNAKLEDLGVDAASMTPILRVYMKGGVTRVRPLTEPLQLLLKEHQAERGHPSTGPLIQMRDGSPIDRLQVWYLVQRLARLSGVENWKKITPHSLRHTFNTVAREAGASLEDRQQSLGHASAVTTQLYDHTTQSVAHDPVHQVADLIF